MLPSAARDYLLNALNHAPTTLIVLVSGLANHDSAWNTRPNPDRFSLREIVAHLADWEDVWKERFVRTVEEEVPLLLRPEVNHRAEQKGYATADPQECLDRFRDKRAEQTKWLHSLPEEAWARHANLDRMGSLPLSGFVALALAHDAYHVRQVVEWLGTNQQP